jgi:hypothetical protein
VVPLKTQRKQQRQLSPALAEIIAAEFAGEARAQKLFFSFLSCSAYDKGVARECIDVARDAGNSWNLRSAVILMLEHGALMLWEKEGATTPESQCLLESLGLLSGGVIREAVLKDGFSTTAPGAFAAELRSRLSRLNYIHAGIRGIETEPQRLLDFIYTSRRLCKLSFARYLLDPAKVAEWILAEVRASNGLPRNAATFGGDQVRPPLTSGLSEFDRELIASLRSDNQVLWVAEQTSSELNSLVGYPIGTVALVIKPPGSDMEFEAKRAGLRGDHLLDIVYERNGKPVPASHRLQGASYGHMADYEYFASARFSEIYRRVHGVEPPMSRCLGVTAISSVPNERGAAHLVEYLSDHRAFGTGFDAMRAEMQRCVEAFEGEDRRDNLVGPIGLTTRFIIATVPNQAWMAGTSSFRLDRTANLLSDRGAEIYFVEGLKRAFTVEDARRLGDEILQEVLGVYRPPDCGGVSYGDYIEAALSMPRNRAMADKTYLDCVADIGLYWGTLLGIGGWTEGESFVCRNVGLKSRWQGGQWRTRICFMDHDCMSGLGAPDVTPNAAWSIEGMRKDSDWICEDRSARGEFACLREIYRVSAPTEVQGEELFRTKVSYAYATTREAMGHSGSVHELFDQKYVDSLTVRDQLIWSYLCNRGSDAGVERWKAEVKARMPFTLYAEESLDYFFDTVRRNAHRLKRYAFLYKPE